MIFLVVGTAPVIAAADRHRGKMMPTPDSAMFTERFTFAGIRVHVPRIRRSTSPECAS